MAMTDSWEEGFVFARRLAPGCLNRGDVEDSLDFAQSRRSLERLRRKQWKEPDVRKAGVHLGRGISLIDVAVRSESVAWCIDPSDSEETARGQQWRLVMAIAGLEQVFNAIERPSSSFRSKVANIVDRHRSNLGGYPRIPTPTLPPEHRRTNQDGRSWWAFENAGEFFGVRASGGDRTWQLFLEDWLHGERELQSWVDVLHVAYAIRCATAHGALTSFKVVQWELERPVRSLVDAIQVFTSSLLAIARDDPSVA